MKSSDINSLDDYIKFQYPEPNIIDCYYKFFEAWGYEQYLIRVYGHDLEQLRIIESANYNKFRIAKMFDSKDLKEAFVGLKLVNTKKILHRFLLQSAPKSYPGVILWEEENNKYFCIFPGNKGVGGLFGQLMGLFDESEIEITGELFTTEEDLLNKIDTSKIASQYELNNHVCYIVEVGNVFVNNTNDCYHGNYTIEYSPAEYNYTKNKWIYSKNKKKFLREYNLSCENLEYAKILE